MYCSKCGVALVDGKCPVCGRAEAIRAKSCGKWALISVIVTVALYIILYGLMGGMIAYMSTKSGTNFADTVSSAAIGLSALM